MAKTDVVQPVGTIPNIEAELKDALYSVSIETHHLEKDQDIRDFATGLPEEFERTVHIKAYTVRNVPNLRLTFIVKEGNDCSDDNDKISRPYVEVFDADGTIIHSVIRKQDEFKPRRLKKAERTPLEPPPKDLPALARDFIEAYNAAPDDSGKAVFLYEVLTQIGRDDLLPLEAFTVAAQPAPPAPESLPAAQAKQPMKWLARPKDDDRTPPEFIRDEFESRKGLKRADLLHEDPPLYRALAKWLLSNPMPDWLDLPTKKQVNDRQLAAGVPTPSEWLESARQNLDPEVKERLRLYEVARSRERRASITPK